MLQAHRLNSIIAGLFLLLTKLEPASAEVTANSQDVFKQDIVLKAMHDELERSIKHLEVSNKAKPYYIRYEVTDSNSFHSGWQDGAKLDESDRTERRVDIDLHAGDYAFDNTARIAGFYPFSSSRYLPMDNNNYWGIRRGLWLLTDDAYKQATEQLEKLNSYKKGHAVRNLYESFCQEKANQMIGELVEPSGHGGLKANWDDRLRRLSLVFRNYPELRKSFVTLDAYVQTARDVTTEGTVTRRSATSIDLGIAAYALTKDGAEGWDLDYVRAQNEADIPDQAQLEAMARRLADNLSANATAERKDYYFGPVLFEGQSACELVCHGIAPLLCATPGDNLEPHNTLLRSLNNRVMPSFLSITDDPTLKTYEGKPWCWDVDSDGMPCRKTQLIDHGFLRDLLSGRTPVFPGEHSNGHSFSGDVVPTTIVVEAHAPLTKTALHRKLIELARQKGLKEALIVRRITPRTALEMSGTAVAIRSDSLAIYRPIEIFSLDLATGVEKRIRGLKFGVFDRARLEAIAAAGNDSKAYFTVNWAGNIHSLVTPSLLVNDMELEEDTEPTFSPYPLTKPTPTN